MSILIDFLLYFMYPPRCPVCGELNGDGVPCPECIDGLEKQKITGEICKKCGRNINVCSCKGKNYLFSGICAVYTNAGVARDSVYAIKYNDRPYAAEFFGRETGAVFAARFKNVKPDMVCAVPMSAASKRKRDHNHAALIAKAAQRSLVCRTGIRRLKSFVTTRLSIPLTPSKGGRTSRACIRRTAILPAKRYCLWTISALPVRRSTNVPSS